MKNNLEYYQHKVDSHNHWKFKSLRREYLREFKQDGWAGEGKFWALNNMIAESESAMLDIDHSIKVAAIAADIDFSIEEFEIFLDILVNRCKLIKRTGNTLTTKRVNMLYCDVETQRERERQRKASKNTVTPHGKPKFPAETPLIPPENETFREDSTPENIHSIVKYSKVNTGTTTVVPATAVPKNGIIGLKSDINTGISDLAKKNGVKKNTKKARPRKKNPDSEPYWLVLRRIWVDFNLKHLHFKVEPIPTADYSFMHRIVEKLRERGTDQGVPWTEQEAVVRWEKFLSTAYNSDKWLHDHFEMKNLTTQMQTIFNLVENGRTETNVAANGAAAHKSKLGTSDARMEANRKFGLAGKVFPSGHK